MNRLQELIVEQAFVIRRGTPDDTHDVLELLAKSAVAQGSPGSLCVDVETLLRDGFGDQPRFYLLIAEIEHRTVGLALYFFTYSTWISTNGLYLEDLYVEPEYRRLGIARGLMRELAKIARDAGCGRFQWLVLRSNAAAIRFYESLGAGIAEPWALMQLYRDDIERLASS
jgi:GNAT superfamily N-acetyltransferase